MGKVLKVAAMATVAVGILLLAAPTGGLSIAAGVGAFLGVSTAVASAIISIGLSVASPAAFYEPRILGARVISPGTAGPVWRLAMRPLKGVGHWRRFAVLMARGDCLGASCPDGHYMLVDRKAEIRAGDIVAMMIDGVCISKAFRRATVGTMQVEAICPPETTDVPTYRLAWAHRVRFVSASKLAVCLASGALTWRAIVGAFMVRPMEALIAWGESGAGAYEWSIVPHRLALRLARALRDVAPAYDERLMA